MMAKLFDVLLFAVGICLMLALSGRAMLAAARWPHDPRWLFWGTWLVVVFLMAVGLTDACTGFLTHALARL